MRIALVVASLALVGGTTVACGGGSGGAPDDASEKDFCEVINAFPEAQDGKIKQDDWDDWVDEIKDTGTPEDIGDDARDGFETSVDLLEDVDIEADDEELTKDLEEAEDDLSKDEKSDVKAFDDYRTETCTPEVPTEDPTP